MSSSTRPERPNRLVMGLGIATVVLFSVNLLAMLSQRVWPKLQDLEMFESESAVERVAPLVELHELNNDRHAVYSFVTKHRKKRCHKSHDHSVDVHFEHSIDSDLDRLEREIEIEMDRLDFDLDLDLSDAKSDLKEAISLKLHVDSPNSVFIQRSMDMSELEEEMENLSRTFEVRVKKHEEAARTAYERARVRRIN